MKEFFKDIRQYITPCNTALILINIAVYIVKALGQRKLGFWEPVDDLALAWWKVFDEHEYYRLITHTFIHADIVHIFNNMLLLGFVGSTVERLIGSFKYLVNYLICGVIAGLASIIYSRWYCFNVADNYPYSIGASGAVFGVVGLLLFIVIVNKGRVADISINRLILFLILTVYGGLADVGIDNAAHIGGLIFGFISGTALYDARGGNR